MAVESTMLPLGSPAPDFKLTDTVSGGLVGLSDFADKAGVLVMFICNHCPYVKHVRVGLAQLSADYENSGIGIIAISSNDPTSHPDDSPEAMTVEAAAYGYRFPYLFDETQEVAKAYTAGCTPDFFLFGPERTLVYRGQFDSSRPNTDIPVTGEDLRAAMEAVANGTPVAELQRPSIGCGIKWRPGNEPSAS